MPTEGPHGTAWRFSDSPTVALTVPPDEGARRLALHWLRGLQEARERWRGADASTDASAPTPEGSSDARREALHKARVALRRLRSVIRENRRVLDLGGRVERKLRALNQATNAARDADVQRAWLDAEQEALGDAARMEADRLRAVLASDLERQSAGVSAAFARHFDRVESTLVRRLASWQVEYRLESDGLVTVDDGDGPFAERLARRVTKGGRAVAAALDALCEHAPAWRDDGAAALEAEAQDAMHALRIGLKRQRAMLAAFASLDGAIAEWYDMATRGQDLLGALRDAWNLARLARDHSLPALADAIEAVAIGHAGTFSADWCAADCAARVRELSERAARALESHGSAPIDAEAEVPPPLEIERKYLLRAVPPRALEFAPLRIDQGWLPGQLLKERLRRTTTPDGERVHSRTVKFGTLGARVELEEPCDTALFETLWPYTSAARISKHRHPVPDGGFVWEIDVFLDRPLVFAEVELAEGQAVPPLPDWLAPWVVRDVTEEPAFTNSAMARAGGIPDGATTPPAPGEVAS